MRNGPENELMTNATHGIRRAWIGAIALLLAVPAAAHHSTAMYDLDKTLTLKGTVKVFHWTNLLDSTVDVGCEWG
jgi:hypothetical protein